MSQTYISPYWIHTVYSQNGKYFLKTVPFDNILETSTGRTTIFTSDSIKEYEVDRHFSLSKSYREVFLSNDGKTIVYVLNREFKWDGIQHQSIEIFKNGISVMQFYLTDLFDCDDEREDCYLLYREAIDTVIREYGERKVIYKKNATEFEKQLTQKATFLENDTLYIFTKAAKVLVIDLNTLDISSTSLSEVSPERFNAFKPFDSQTEDFDTPSLGLPNLSSGLTLEMALAKSLDMSVIPDETREKYTLKKYSVSVEIIVGKDGSAEIAKVETNGGLPEEKVRAFIVSQKFATNSIPSKVEKWRFKGHVALMNKNKRIAKKEMEQELQQEIKKVKNRIFADSINGIYIPKNIEECFTELDKILAIKDISAIKNLKNRNETVIYHHGLGRWIRNNWGLWGISRLQQYFMAKGFRHPDDMSGTILEFYYDWLNGQHEKWKEFEAR